MPEDHQHKDTPKDALLSALASCEVGTPWKDVLIIFNRTDGTSGHVDSDLDCAQAGYLCLLFLIWMANANTGVVMGALKKDLFAHVGFKEPTIGAEDGQTGREAD